MLHVILTILKVIGIVLLVILGILLAVILLVLFVPIRYRLHGRYENGIAEADGRVSWLLHLVRVKLFWKDNQGRGEIRILWFVIKSFAFPEKETASAAAGETQKTGSDDGTKGSLNAQESSGSDRKRQDGFDQAGRDQERKEGSSDSFPEDPAGRNQAEEKADQKRLSGGKPVQEEEHGSRDGKLTRVFGKIRELVRSLILNIPGLPAEALDRIERKLDRMEGRIDQFLRKVEPYLDATTEHAVRKSIRLLKSALRGYVPRKIEGFLHFGTGSPDMTGKLAGLILVLMPVSGNEYVVNPDFYESVFETDTTVFGCIRLYRLIWMMIRFMADKECRIFLFRLLGRDKKKKGKQKNRRKTGRKPLEQDPAQGRQSKAA